jgi:hypothetical protein
MSDIHQGCIPRGIFRDLAMLSTSRQFQFHYLQFLGNFSEATVVTPNNLRLRPLTRQAALRVTGRPI